MPRRPCPRAVALENRAFLKAVTATGNAHEAARRLGASRSRFTRRRAADPAFAAGWDAALTLAHAALGCRAAAGKSPRAPMIVRLANGRHQLRAAPAGAVSAERRQAFLAALSASANVRLSARAAGHSHTAFYGHRDRDPGFAREWRLALQMGYERIECALLASSRPNAYADDGWRNNTPARMPPMTCDQALQLLYLHQKEARLLAEPTQIKRRRRESDEALSYRLSAMYEARLERSREEFRVAEAERRARGEPPYWGGEWPGPHEPPAPVLPAWEQVTGASTASGNPPHNEGVALFGGWRLKDWAKRAKG